jgi:hypothetical protein
MDVLVLERFVLHKERQRVAENVEERERYLAQFSLD